MNMKAEKAKLAICISQFVQQHLEGFNVPQSVKTEQSKPQSKERLIFDLEHLINQLKDILLILTDKSCSDENEYSDRLKETLNSISAKEDNYKSSNGVNIVTVSSIDYVPKPDPKLVQIQASKAEVERRILAFIERKRIEVDASNKREFIDAFGEDESCARVRAVFMKRQDSKSHVKVSKVLNKVGPQIQNIESGNLGGMNSQNIKVKSECGPPILDSMSERIGNMEAHLKLKPDSKRDLAERIKNLEERILYLESISPEYFSSQNQPNEQKSYSFDEPATKYQFMTISEIDERIHQLKQRLRHKAMAVKPEID